MSEGTVDTMTSTSDCHRKCAILDKSIKPTQTSAGACRKPFSSALKRWRVLLGHATTYFCLLPVLIAGMSWCTNAGAEHQRYRVGSGTGPAFLAAVDHCLITTSSSKTPPFSEIFLHKEKRKTRHSQPRTPTQFSFLLCETSAGGKKGQIPFKQFTPPSHRAENYTYGCSADTQQNVTMKARRSLCYLLPVTC